MIRNIEQGNTPEIKLTRMVTYQCFECGGGSCGHKFDVPQPTNYPSSVECNRDSSNTATAVKSREIRGV